MGKLNDGGLHYKLTVDKVSKQINTKRQVETHIQRAANIERRAGKKPAGVCVIEELRRMKDEIVEIRGLRP